MAKRRTARALLGELQVQGRQRFPLEADLLAQIVVMLGRQLAVERGELPPVDDAPAADADDGELS